jgi:tRNA pseudouridine38-40 synthase
VSARTLKLTICYEGTRLVGWQRQPDGVSVQGLLEEALARFEGAPVTVHGAGRTDAGVHALGQVASVTLTCAHPPAVLARGLNAALPTDVRVVDVQNVADGFHARFSAHEKTYRYLIHTGPVVSPFVRPYVWPLQDALDLNQMRTAASAIVGTHDFAAFHSAGSSPATTVRTIRQSNILPADTCAPPFLPAALGAATAMDRTAIVIYEVVGNGFLRHMVRSIVGTLVEVGRGRRAPDSMAALLTGGARADAGVTAPAQGLFLVAVDYH